MNVLREFCRHVLGAISPRGHTGHTGGRGGVPVLARQTARGKGTGVPGRPTFLRLLPPENIKIRFFVPQSVAETLRNTQKISINSRADNQKIPAQITYISTEAEYTPPIIYSNETKEKLTYMIEAYPESKYATLLHPGQPVEVSLE